MEELLHEPFYNISVIEVAPIFEMALGLDCRRDRKKENEKS